MDTPFPYDKFVTGKNFIGRKQECTVLSNLITQHEHVALYEPPKTGKTSLIQQAMYSMRYGQRAFTVGPSLKPQPRTFRTKSITPPCASQT